VIHYFSGAGDEIN